MQNFTEQQFSTKSIFIIRRNVVDSLLEKYRKHDMLTLCLSQLKRS